MIVRLHLHQQVGVVVKRSVDAIRARKEARGAAALDDRGVVRVGRKHALAVGRLEGVANHPEQRLRLRHAVDQPIGVEDLVPAVFGVRLGEHHQLGVGGVALKPREGGCQVVHFVAGERQAEAQVGRFERGAGLGAQGDARERARRAGRVQRTEVVVEQEHLRHAVVQCAEVGGATTLEVPAHAALHPRNGAQAAAVEDVRCLARPRRDSARAGHDGKQRGAGFRRQVAARPVAQQFGGDALLPRIEFAVDEQQVDELGEDVLHLRRLTLQGAERPCESRPRKRWRADEDLEPGHGRQARRAAKNSARRRALQSARMPPSTRSRWFDGACSNIATAPVFGADAPYAKRSMRACSSAPAHIKHGSTVTYIVAPGSR